MPHVVHKESPDEAVEFALYYRGVLMPFQQRRWVNSDARIGTALAAVRGGQDETAPHTA
jgi:hypothetical protein